MPKGVHGVSFSEVSDRCTNKYDRSLASNGLPEVHRPNSGIKYLSQSLHQHKDFPSDKLKGDQKISTNYRAMNTRLTAQLLIPSVCYNSGRKTHRFQQGLIRQEKLRKNDEKINAHSSNAVQMRVKKISEDFIITQMKFENSYKSKSVMINLGRSQLLSPKLPRGLSSVKSTCSKCENFSSKSGVVPLLSTEKSQNCSNPTQDSTQENTEELYCNPKDEEGEEEEEAEKEEEKEEKGEEEFDEQSFSAPVEDLIFSEEENCHAREENPDSSHLHRLETCQSKNHHSYRVSTKKRCLSASISPRPQCITLVQLKRARQFTERAIKEGRVFSIYGHFPAVRQALKSRGWVEKMLPRSPYVNPHPANCVCFQAHCTSTTSVNGSTSATTSGEQAQKISVACGRPQLNFIERNRRMCKFFRNKQINLEEVEEAPQKYDDNQLEDMEIEDDSVTLSEAENVESVQDDDVSTQDYLPLKEESDSPSPSPEKKSDTKGHRFKFNPTTLCPLEIRCGIDKCINESNESLYKFTVPAYSPKKLAIKCPDQPAEQEEECSPPPSPSPKPSPEAAPEEELQDTQFEDAPTQPDAPDPEEDSKDTEDEEPYNPLDPYPDLSFNVNDVDPSLVGRLLKNVEPNLIWTWTRDTVSYKHLTKDQLVNRFPNTIFTTKHGLCSTMQQLHWFSEAPSAETFVPRGYCIGQAEERVAFEQDYRLTACLGLLGWLTETYAKGGYSAVASTGGEVSLRRVWLAVVQVQQFVESCGHDHLDTPLKAPLHHTEWEGIFSAHNRTVYRSCKLKATQQQLEAVVQESSATLKSAQPHWPQLSMDGVRNTWIVKPGAQSRGRGILIMHSITEILSLVQSPFIYETKYVVQKYMERPFLVYNTKFDIRQWFLVTDWNPLTVWMYRSSYVRFCSQEYDMSRTDEAVHLSNNAIQCKYTNGRRDRRLPQENIEAGWGKAWQTTVYPGMRDALVAAMLAAQVHMDSFRTGFELFGADFMLTQDLRPWLIEINSSPCMAPTSSVTRRLCAQCLQDIIKVVVDYRASRSADTGQFELIHRDAQKLVPLQPYLGINLQVTGKQLRRQATVERPRRLLRDSTVQASVRPLRLVSLSLAP